MQKLAKQIARFHHLKVPINKTANMYIQKIPQMVEEARKNCPEISLIDSLPLPTLQSFDLLKEYTYLMEVVEKLKSPVVFSHNDFRSSNILFATDTSEVLLVDFESNSYGPRGFDLATFLLEWGREKLFETSELVFPDDKTLSIFLKLYIEEVDKIVPEYAQNEKNSLQTHLKETKTMFLVNLLFYTAFMLQLKDSLVSSVPFDGSKKMVNDLTVCLCFIYCFIFEFITIDDR